MSLGPVSAACRKRLLATHGRQADPWLDRVPKLLDQAAERWKLKLSGYHDAGHASVLAVATSIERGTVVLKAWFDRERYVNETAALRCWEPVNGRVIRTQDDELAVACLDVVGGVVAGRSRPPDDERRVAAALQMLHGHDGSGHCFPLLERHLAGRVEPRIRNRARRFAGKIPVECVGLGFDALRRRDRHGAPVLLHADLYKENVPFGLDGKPVFLDPLPMRGNAAFDWAFFVIYHDLATDPVARLHLAAEASNHSVAALMPWCLMLCLDGLLYYHEVVDGREPRMAEIMATLATEAGVS